MDKIEFTSIDEEKEKIINEINSLGYGFDYEYASYSNNTIIIPNIGKYDKELFISYLNQHQITWCE